MVVTLITFGETFKCMEITDRLNWNYKRY